MKKNKQPLYHCSECGSSYLHMVAWVDPNNNNKYISDYADSENFWCCSCEKHVDIITHSEFMKNADN